MILSTLRENALEYCIDTSSDMIAALFLNHKLIQPFVSAGMIDDKTRTCPDMYAIIVSFKIDCNNVIGGRKWFIDMLP